MKVLLCILGVSALVGLAYSACVDKNSKCASWAGRGFCKGRYERYMRANCAKSCNVNCGGGGGDGGGTGGSGGKTTVFSALLFVILGHASRVTLG